MNPFCRKLWLDLETFCSTPIKDGVYRYSENVRIDILAYAFDDGAVFVHDNTLGNPFPPAVLEAFEDPNCQIFTHNVQFDRVVLKARGYNIPVERFYCTMTQAMLCSLPGSLDKLCDILQVPQDKAKLKDGHSLVLKFCKPLGVKSKLKVHDRATHPIEWARYLEYAKNDVEAMREVHKRLPKRNYELEHRVWCLDQKINDRGFAIDIELVHAAINAIENEMKANAAEVKDLTLEEVDKATRRAVLLNYLNRTYDLGLQDLTSSTVAAVLDKIDLHPDTRRLLTLRLQACTTSTAKYKALNRSVSADNRLRGGLRYAGASRTWRWSGRLFQPQNLPQPVRELKGMLDTGIELLKYGAAEMVYESVMPLTSSVIRGCIVAPPGKKLCIADLSNIEGRVAAWLGGEDWKLEAFRQFDLGLGPDLYRASCANTFGMDIDDIDDFWRSIGKVLELSMGYAGGVGAFLTFCEAYGVSPADIAVQAPTPDRELREKALWSWGYAIKTGGTYGLDEKTYRVLDYLKHAWRAAHPNLVSYWKELESAWREAIVYPQQRVIAGRMTFLYNKPWLGIIAPSGRTRLYYQPVAEGKNLSYQGLSSLTHKWGSIYTFSGKLFENCVQSMARDVMVDNMEEIDHSGYEIVLTVHDELITETLDVAEYSSSILAGMMARTPGWCAGLPLAAKGFETHRYRKD